jgi:hypothetical protein
MIEWPARCHECQEVIEDWSEAGLYDRSWVHKACYTDRWNQAHAGGVNLPDLRSPVERSSQLEMPMLISLLLFHFGLGFAVIGWIMLDQGRSSDLAALLLVIGIVIPLIGLGGIAVNVIGRRRIEAIRQEIDMAGGWKPGR